MTKTHRITLGAVGVVLLGAAAVGAVLTTTIGLPWLGWESAAAMAIEGLSALGCALFGAAMLYASITDGAA